jgi:ligand-binding sensor domain-containing protein
MAQPFPDLYFHSITEKDGLSSNLVNSVTQDANGIIWIATQNGLNRYDGIRIKKIFSNPADSNSLPVNNIQVFTDPSKTLWINGSSSFVSKYNINSGKFITAKKIFQPRFFFENNSTFITSDSGLYKWQPDNKVIKLNISLDTVNYFGLQRYYYEGIVVDNKGNYWAANFNRLYHIDKVTKNIITRFTIPDNVDINNVFFDKKNRCWVSANKGVYLFDAGNGKFHLFNKSLQTHAFNKITRWKFKEHNYIVICGDIGIGLLVIDEETLQYRFYNNELSSAENPEGAWLTDAFVDSDNNLWLATNEGVKMVSAAQMLFRQIPIVAADGKNKSRTSNGFEVYNLAETNEGYWLTKRYGGGIFYYDKTWRLKNHWYRLVAPQKDRYNTTSNTIDGFDFRQRSNTMYITTESGLVIMDVQSHSIKIIYPDNDSLSPRLRTIVPENDTTWWIRSFRKGIYLFNPANNTFKKCYSITDSAQNILNVNYLLLTKHNRLFATTFFGVYAYNKNLDRFTKINTVKFPNEQMLGMAVDKNGVIWVGTGNGLTGWNPDENKMVNTFTEYPDAGLVGRVCVDKYNNIWFNCQQGYWCWMQDKQQMIKFGYSMKLPENRTEGGFAVTSDGKVYGGGRDAVVEFDPDLIRNYRLPSRAVITDITVNGNNILPSFNKEGNKDIHLKPQHRNISILFSVTDYSAPGNYELFYRILPGNDNWAKAENGQVLFDNLDHGSYAIEVKGKSNLTGQYSKSDLLNVTIEPYWYQTNLFKALLAMIIASLGLFIYRFRIRQIRKKAKLKSDYENKMIHLEMQNLRSQMNPHFIFNSLNSINSFIVENKTHLASDYLTKFSRLIRLILDNSKNESVSLEKELETLRLYFLMESVRFDNRFDYSIYVEPGIDTQLVKVPPMIIQPYAENAIWHGLLHKAEKGKVEVNIKRPANRNSSFTQSESLVIEITDDGVGRSRAAALKSKNSTSNKSYGMQITAQRVKQLNKQNNIDIIDLKDENGNALGTKIIIFVFLD